MNWKNDWWKLPTEEEKQEALDWIPVMLFGFLSKAFFLLFVWNLIKLIIWGVTPVLDVRQLIFTCVHLLLSFLFTGLHIRVLDKEVAKEEEKNKKK